MTENEIQGDSREWQGKKAGERDLFCYGELNLCVSSHQHLKTNFPVFSPLDFSFMI